MAKIDAKTETTDGPITYVSRPMSAIPKRKVEASGPDLATANILLALVFEDGSPKKDGDDTATASDGAAYETNTTARTAANKAKRLVKHVLPVGFNVTTRVYQPDGSESWEWALWLEPAPAAKAAVTA